MISIKNYNVFLVLVLLFYSNTYSQDSFFRTLDSIYKKPCSNDTDCLNNCVSYNQSLDSIVELNIQRYLNDVDKKIMTFKNDKMYVRFWKKNRKDYLKLYRILKKSKNDINKIYLPYTDSNLNDLKRCELLLIYKRFIISNLIYLERFQFPDDKYIEIEKEF